MEVSAIPPLLFLIFKGSQVIPVFTCPIFEPENNIFSVYGISWPLFFRKQLQCMYILTTISSDMDIALSLVKHVRCYHVIVHNKIYETCMYCSDMVYRRIFMILVSIETLIFDSFLLNSITWSRWVFCWSCEIFLNWVSFYHLASTEQRQAFGGKFEKENSNQRRAQTVGDTQVY